LNFEKTTNYEKATRLVSAKQTAASSRTSSSDSQVQKNPSAAVPISLDVPSKQPTELPQHVSTINRSTALPKVTTRELPLVVTTPPQHAIQQVNYLRTEKPSVLSVPKTSHPSIKHDWQAHLQNSIHDLQSFVQPTPGSTDEVHQHMRLRLLQLLGGNEETALQPIPGATASQQDYWNKQIFAVSTFLDNEHQPDDKRRAAGALMHLDQARAKLAELATLQVRKLAFVDSVEGYGAYESQEDTKFRPGEQVTLYAEIENFSSESTKEGYRTRLGTSYEVIDKRGKRVDSAQFPEVEDLCRSPRRDFHMQYTVTLPKRIYPEQYELRLIITDQRSHKIGQASVPFEISE